MFSYITAPSGSTVPARVSGSPGGDFHIEYQPNEVGRHKVTIRYADVDINGSPFFPEVYDTSLVRVGKIPDGVVGKPVHFDGKRKFNVIFWNIVFRDYPIIRMDLQIRRCSDF